MEKIYMQISLVISFTLFLQGYSSYPPDYPYDSLSLALIFFSSTVHYEIPNIRPSHKILKQGYVLP